MQRQGIFYAMIAYIIWGVIPLFWKQLTTISSLEIIYSRVIWAFIFTVLFIVLMKQRKLLLVDLRYLFSNKSTALRLFVASLIISLNWLIYIWAVNNNHILQASLGYYINPLITVIFGVLFFQEHLSRATIISVCIAALGVIVLTVSYGEFPWVSISLALSFAVYGVLKKKVKLDATRGLAIETLFILPLAIIGYIIFSINNEVQFFAGDFKISVLLAMGGIVTAIPLILFAKGAQKIPLYLIGFIQYLAPTISFFIGVFVYDEPFSHVELTAFICIWIAVAVFSAGKMLEIKKQSY